MTEEMVSSVLDSVGELSIRAEGSDVRRASAWIESACRERGVPANEIARLDVCLNEALANILSHGNTAALSAPVILYLAVHDESRASEAIVTVSDAGAAFDPLGVLPKARPKTLAEVQPGGLGLQMIRHSADSLHYRYSEGRNQLSFGVRWSGCRDA
ncbi:MAG: ATP-binding protein [Betaproteobacteria bacterium]